MIAELDILEKTPSRESIQVVESILLQHPQTAIEPVHHFADGIYAREITIPAGTVLTGKIHRTEHLNILSKGEITVWTEDGMKRIEAPFTMVSRPGTKRVGYAHTECVWTTIHANPDNMREMPALEERLILPQPQLNDRRNLP